MSFDIRSIFSAPDTLDELPAILEHTHRYKSQLNASIAADVAKYNNSYTDLRPDTNTLVSSIHTIKTHSRATQESIAAMTSSIQQLDSYKKNLVLTMTVVKRLQMLINANNTLVSIISSHKYHDILQLLGVIKQLLEYFKPYRSIDQINAIHLSITTTQNKLVDDIFNDFEDVNTSDTSLDTSSLASGCEVLYLIDPKYKDKLLNVFYHHRLKEIKTIFNISEEAGSLENLSRRFIYFNNTLNTVQSKYAKFFPADWNIVLELAKIFCKITSQDIMDLLRRKEVDSKSLMDNLVVSLEFEKSLNERFKTDAFNQIISKAFEPYLLVYIKEQERYLASKMVEFLGSPQLPEELNDNDTGEFLAKLKVNNVPNIANSSIELFRCLNKIVAQVVRITNGEVLLDLAGLFNNVLAEYHNRILLSILPKNDDDLAGNGTDAAKYLTMLLNTGDYVLNNISELHDSMAASIVPRLRSKVSFDNTKDIYYRLINKAVSNLLIKISLDLKVSWRQFENANWNNDISTSSVSSYMDEMKRIVVQNLRIISPLIIRDSYVRNFDNKLVEMLVNLFANHLRFAKPLTLTNVEQLTRDVDSLKNLALDFPLFSDPHYDPDSSEKKVSKSYQSLVSREFSSLEAILKVVATPPLPVDDFIESYFQNIGDKSVGNLAKILALKGIDSQAKYIETFRLQLRVDNSQLIEQSTLLSNMEVEEEEKVQNPQNSQTPATGVKSPRLLPGPINNFEKNLRDFALNGENHVIKLNENFKNFGKFFRKDQD